jgi:glucose-fructose oxidoreductase
MKKDRYKVVIIGFAHMHINEVAACFYAHPKIKLAACADTVPAVPEIHEGPYTRGWNLRFVREHYGIEKVYDDYVAMLEAEKPDLAIITSENVWHRQIVQDCALRGVDVCIEKPMAMSYSDALAMVRDARATGIRLLVNWPLTWRPYLHQMKQHVDEGAIGQLIQVKYRAGHTGPLGPGPATAVSPRRQTR